MAVYELIGKHFRNSNDWKETKEILLIHDVRQQQLKLSCVSSEGAICKQCLALRRCGTCKLQYLEAHFRKKRTIYIIYVYILSNSSRGKAIAFLACKVPGCNNAWRAKLYHVENQLVANHAILHAWLSPEVFFNIL